MFYVGEIPFQFLRWPQWKVVPAIEYAELCNGKWGAVDRGFGQDIYTSSVTLHGTEDEIAAMLNTVNGARGGPLTLSSVDGGLFPPYMDQSGTFAATFDLDRRTHAGWGDSIQLFSVKATIRYSVPFPVEVDSPDLGVLRPQSGYEADASLSASALYYYNPAVNVIDNNMDSGKFTGMFRQTFEETQQIMAFILGADGRGAASAIDFDWLPYPFGPRKSATPNALVKLEEIKRAPDVWDMYDLKISFLEA